MAIAGSIWLGAPDSDELLHTEQEAAAAVCPPDAEGNVARQPALVYVDDSFDMRVGDRTSKRRRIVSGGVKEVWHGSSWQY